MSIKLRLGLLLGLLLLGFGAGLLALRVMENRAREAMTSDDRQARIRLLDHWIDTIARALPQALSEFAQSEDLAASLANGPDPAAQEKIRAALARAGLATLWVVQPDGSTQWQCTAQGQAAAPELPIGPPDFVALANETPSPHFFAERDGELSEVAVRRLAAGDRRPRPWLVAARPWDEAQRRALANLTDSRVTLVGPAEIARAPSPPGHLVVVRPLLDWQGHPLRTLRLDYLAPEIDRAVASDWHQAWIFILFGVLVLAALGLALQHWILRPLNQIGASLAHNEPARVEALAAEPSELGRVAQLVQTSFAQREAVERGLEKLQNAHAALARSEASLRRTLEERAQLGRDLHDGVIQSLYAAGMGLASIRDLLHGDQVEAAARLEQTREALNETIHDVRNFIIGLEPEALKSQTFSQAMAKLVETMQGLREFQSRVEIDEAVAERLTLAQRVHVLQIAREAVSNSLRHGLAGHIAVTLRATGGRTEFEIVDDGLGFDATESGGQGLRNLAQRARELGAELGVESQRGRGTHVRLAFFFPHL